MREVSYFTKEGLEKLKNDLSELKTKGRSDIAKQISEARDKGDLSENAEYDAAKEAQGHLELKISKLEKKIATARIIDVSRLDRSKVSILSKVKIKNLQNNASFEYTLMPEEEADLKQSKLSIQSPIGKGLLSKKVGDKVEIQTPGGKVMFEILAIN